MNEDLTLTLALYNTTMTYKSNISTTKIVRSFLSYIPAPKKNPTTTKKQPPTTAKKERQTMKKRPERLTLTPSPKLQLPGTVAVSLYGRNQHSMVVGVLQELGISLPLAWEAVLDETAGVVQHLDAPLLVGLWLPFGHVQPAPDHTHTHKVPRLVGYADM